MKKSIWIINGPNLNLLGVREPEVYGHKSFDDYFAELQHRHTDVEIRSFQSNSEGALIDKVQEVGFSCDGIILNGGGYTHTSVALADAVAAVRAPVVEVHISNVAAREDFRRRSFLSPVCRGTISGFGLMSYELALRALINGD